MGAPIRHKGEVIRIEGDRIDVKMTVESACASCRAKSVCGMDESEDRIVSVKDSSLSSILGSGDKVIISISEGIGMKAVMYSYILPFFVLLAVLVIASLVQESEGVAAIAALLACGIYYMVLYIFRHKVEKEIIFKIDKITE
ncbi:MAG: SoxR reducing system RseC family protein [Tidjanibacter sp.]|nr:SoxR reducing system RseC family protein [Tidjanibacter sp.]MBR6830895.1 SoxR reducing system RseC family protein [Tidjanibacter sp.]